MGCAVCKSAIAPINPGVAKKASRTIRAGSRLSGSGHEENGLYAHRSGQQRKIPSRESMVPGAEGSKTAQSPAEAATNSKLLSVVNASTLGGVGAGGDQRTPIKRNMSTARVKRMDVNTQYDVTGRVLGSGISGEVRIALHKLTGRKYAIKTLSLENVNPKKAAMLHNEVAIYLQLDHPNIAKLIEVYETEKAIYLVMELCTGRELYDRLSMKKKYSERDAAHVAKQMLSAINYCHHHHICHRDLKLENWVYADPSEAAPLKLIDFGFSRIFNPGIPMTAMHGTVYYVSPEVMDGCYKEKCDIWSIGVIVYMLLSGSPPFNGTHDHEILIKIKRGQYRFSGSRWEGISQLAKEFVTLLLVKNPDKRPSAEDALKHPWLHQSDDENNQIDTSVLAAMKEFALGNVMKRAALGVVAMSMTSREVMDLEKTFKALDRENKGTISLHDLAQVLVEHLNIEETEALRIFERVDQTGAREVHYSEFIASTLQAKILKQETLVKEAFQRFDCDGKGYITLEDVRTILGDVYNGSTVEDIFSLCDANKDGIIDYQEFYNALTSDFVDPLFNDNGNNIPKSSSSETARSLQRISSGNDQETSFLAAEESRDELRKRNIPPQTPKTPASTRGGNSCDTAAINTLHNMRRITVSLSEPEIPGGVSPNFGRHSTLRTGGHPDSVAESPDGEYENPGAAGLGVNGCSEGLVSRA